MSTMCSLLDLARAELGNIERGEGAPNGLTSGVGLEKLVPGGIPRGKLTTIYSSEGNFKTTLITQIAVSAAQAGHTVLDLTLEDSAQLVVHRYLARITGVPYGVIHGGTMSDTQRVAVLAANLDPAMRRLIVVDNLEPRWDRVVAAVEAVKQCDILMLDYVQMFGRDPTMLDGAVFGAQQLAKKHNIAIVFVSQQVKPDASNPDPRPQTGNMFGSSALRMGCKLAVGLFRPWLLCKVPVATKGPFGPYAKWITSDPANVDVYPKVLEVHVTKNFAGPTGAYFVLVEPETGVISPFDMTGYL